MFNGVKWKKDRIHVKVAKPNVLLRCSFLLLCSISVEIGAFLMWRYKLDLKIQSIIKRGQPQQNLNSFLWTFPSLRRIFQCILGLNEINDCNQYMDSTKLVLLTRTFSDVGFFSIFTSKKNISLFHSHLLALVSVDWMIFNAQTELIQSRNSKSNHDNSKQQRTNIVDITTFDRCLANGLKNSQSICCV